MPEEFAQFDSQLLDPHGVHGTPLQFPGFEGIPWRGANPEEGYRRSTDPAHMQPRVGCTVFVDALDLNLEADRKRYTDVYQIIANRYGRLGEDRQMPAEPGKFPKVLLRWYLLYTYTSPQRR